MKMIRYTRDNGVAPIISAILLVAITVGMVAVVGVVVVSMTDMGNIPAAGILIEEKQDVVTITHFAGEKLKVGNYYILVDDADRTKDFTGPDLSDGYFGPGDILSWSINSGALRHVSVVYDGEKGTYLLAEKWFDGISGDGGLSAAFTMTSSTGTSRSELPSVLQDAAADLTGGCPMIVSFSPIESSGDAEYLWTFGNGNTSRESNPSQEYTSVGEYTVTLKVTNKTNGGWNSSSHAISVRNPGATTMAWIKPLKLDTSNSLSKQSFYYSAVSSTQAMNGPEWGLQIGTRDAFELKGRTIISGNNNYIIANFKPEKDIWYHLTGIINLDSATFYINAGYKFKRSSLTSGEQIQYYPPVTPATSNYDVDEQFSVTYAMTESEILLIYNSQSSAHE